MIYKSEPNLKPNEHMSDNVYFESISMQLNYEEFEAQAQQKGNLTEVKNSLSHFQMNKSKPNTIKVKKAPTTKRKARAKIKSINSHVSARYKPQERHEEEDILDFFLKRKHNLSSILEGVQDLENETIENINQYKEPRNSDSQLFTQDEWHQILRKIKLRYPDLSAKTRKSLKYITTKLEHLKKASQHEDLPQLWSQAAEMPENGLVNDDIKWLYELDDQQMDQGSSFCNNDEDSDHKMYVMTLSQALGEHAESFKQNPNEEVEIVLDSSPEPSQLQHTDNLQPLLEGDENSQLQTQILLDDSQEANRAKVDVSSVEALIQLANTLESQTQKPQKKNVIQKQASVIVPDYLVLECSKKEEIILSSSPTRDNEVFHTPKFLVESVRSTPLLRTSRIGHLVISPLKLPLPDRVDITQSIYSTARSSPTKTKGRSRTNERDASIFAPARKKYRTSTIEVAGDVPVRTTEKLKVLSTHNTTIDSEVEDSEDENHSYSVIEITHEVNDNESVAHHEKDEGQFSIIQVPSSPSNVGIDHESENGTVSKTTSIMSISQGQLNTIPATQMRNALKQLGFPLERSKADMIQQLERAAKISGTSLPVLLNSDASLDETKSQIHQVISEHIHQNQLWHERILSYEPIVLEEFKQWLESVDESLLFSVSFLQNYCDIQGITTTLATGP